MEPITRRTLLGGGIAAIALTTLSACAKPSGGPAQSGWTEVKFSSVGTVSEQKIYQQMIAAAQEEVLDDLKITLSWQANTADSWDQVMLKFASGTAADVQRIDDDRVYGLALDNKIFQLDKWMLDKKIGIDSSLYGDNFLRKVTVEGYQFSLTPAVSANVLYYNKALFREAGLEAPASWADAWSWEEFEAAARTLTKRNGNNTDVYGLVMHPSTLNGIGYGAGDQALNEDQTECGFAKPETEQVLDAIAQLVRDGYSPTVDVEPIPLFNSGKLAIMWSAMELPAQISDDIEWDIMPLPKSKLHAVTKNHARAFVIPKSAKEPEAAYLALKALAGQAASDAVAKSQWAVPMLKSSANSAALTDHPLPATPAVWSETLGSLDGVTIDIPFPKGPIGDVFAASFVEGPLVNGLLSGQLATRDFIDQARSRVNDEIAKRSWNSSKGLELLQKSGALTDPDTRALA
jgi:multiple sugar transport system substrate-binding protein